MSIRKPPIFANHQFGYVDALNNGMFRAFCQHVVDGDTGDFLLDLGWYNYTYGTLRFYNIDTPELIGTPPEERARAIAALQRVEVLILNKPVLIKTYKEKTSFNRFVAQIFFVPPEDIVEEVPRFSLPLEDGTIAEVVEIADVLKVEGHEKVPTV